jgi:hypothetical protein
MCHVKRLDNSLFSRLGNLLLVFSTFLVWVPSTVLLISGISPFWPLKGHVCDCRNVLALWLMTPYWARLQALE